MNLSRYLPGLLLAAAIAGAAMILSQWPALAARGVSPLVIAIVLGILAGNTIYPRMGAGWQPGLAFSQRILLRIGVAFFGLNISFHQISALGWSVFWLDCLVILLLMLAGIWLGQRLLGMGRSLVLLTTIGSAICGAAAVLAAAPLLKADNQRVAMAVATVVLFGTLAMFIYPLLYPVLGMSPGEFGIYTGSTVHEVAQVLAAGAAVSQEAAETGVIVKLIRVMLLAPTLILLSLWINRSDSRESRSPLYIPWFVIAFILISAVNTWVPIPEQLHAWMRQADLFLLSMAMAALGMDTNIGKLRQLGLKPLLLALLLFVLLLAGGLVLNRLMIGG